jgi:signal transduction histidine kinase
MFITFEPCPDAHDIFKRFGKVFEQTYTRFLDLKKAEEQVREAQLEAALERVRSRSMAMHKSDEIAEVASVLFHQLQQLNIPALRRCLIGIVDETSATLHSWYTSMQGDSSHRIITYPIRGHPVIEAKIKGWRQQKPFSIELSGDELEDLLQYSVSHGFEYPKGEVAATHMVQNHAPFTYGYLEVATHGPISDQDFELLQRFARVFEQTYTRFLDLQKAEALAREAEIQLVLERIRARTMAMHRSEELAETAAVLFQQFNELGVTPERMNIGIMKEDEKIIEFWSTEQGGKKINQLFKTSIEERTTISKLYKAWKSGKKSMVIELSGRELGDWLHYLKNEIGLPFRVELVQDKRYHSTAFFTHGMLLMSTPEPLATETLSLLPRFANVFEQTYTRFLDLQKAEAQVREAQIEAGLERVRAKSMAMHHTSELQEVVNTVAEQLQLLEMDINGGVFITINKEVDEDLCFWGSFGVASSYVQKTCIPFLDRPIITVLRDAIKKGNGFYVEEYTRQEKMEFFKYLFKHPPFNSISEARKKELLSREGGYARSIAVSHYTSIFMINDYGKRFSDGDNDILKRFGKVFEQSYVRFLDLQKAEAQAREAQIEAALERVRAQSMAMHLSQDLQLVVNTVIKQLQKLKITLDTTNIIIFNRDDRTCNFWTGSNSTGKLLVSSWEVPYIDYLWLKDIAHAFETGQEVFTSCYSGDQKKTIFDYLLTSSGFKDLPDDRKKFILDSPVFTPMAAIVKDIAIQVVSYSRKTFFPEEIEIIKRFAKVFEQTYTRFLDLQKAEAREKEAIKQSSLDRVRAEIASMRTSDDLQRITPLIWRELTTLGVPFFRCGVFIVDEDNEKISVYLSTPSGEPLAAWHSEYDRLPLFRATVDHWKKQKVYREEWDKKQFIQFTQSLIDQGMIDSPTRYQAGKDAPEYLALQMIPFEQGMLYVGSAEKLGEEQLAMVRALAEAFSVAYARYEDFRKLEEAKGRVENTLKELRAAQTQLIHAEKMASLGELTAGIAHEIQNPLNFVNNFSEVSGDLIEDMEDRMINGNMEEVKAITEDIRQNLEKINHHGKRASDIVKGMLQHSRTSSGQKEPTDINLLADEYLRLAYHGLRAKDKSFNSDFKTDLDETLPKIKVIPQEIGRVLLNLINNAFYAVSEKQKIAKKDYKPIVTLTTRRTSPLPTGQAGTGGPAPPKGGGQGEENVQISIKDNGPGIPEPIQDKIFQPFFTTKPTGQGTGLGLSLSYDIITKGHHGTLEVETQEGYGTEFIIALPIN